MGFDNELTHEEALAIIKTVVAYNGGRAEFLPGFLKYVNELPLSVSRENNVITLGVPLN